MLRARALVGVVVLAMTAPAGALTPGPGGRRATVSRPWVAPRQYTPAPAAYLQALSAPGLTLGRFRSLRRDYLTTPASAGGGGLTAVPAPVPSDDDTVSFPIKSGDLNGDLFDDFLTLDITYGETPDVALRAHKGSDASVLWSASLGLEAFVGVTDVNDDDASDVVVLTFSDTSAGPDTPVGGALVIQTTQVLRVLDGRTGAQIWGDEIVGHIVVALVQGYPVITSSMVAEQNVLLSLAVTSDADGDGLSDVYTGTVDAGDVRASSGEDTSHSNAGRFNASFRSGKSGAAIGPGLSTLGTNVIPFTSPTPDLSGDGKADYVTVASQQDGFELRAHDTDARAIWTTPVPGLEFPYGIDTTGDARAEVVMDSFDYETFVDTISIYDGVDGHLRWSRSIDEGFGLPGVLDDDGGRDFVFVSFPAPGTIRVEGVSGSTGAAIWGPSDHVTPPPPGSFSVAIVCDCPDDLDGNGATDVLIAFLEIAGDFTLQGQTLTAVSGLDGAVLWERALPATSQLPAPILGDADGDGGGDLLGGRMMRIEGNPFAIVTVRAGASFTPLFDTLFPLGGSGNEYAVFDVFGANLVDAPNAEVVLDFYDGSQADSVLYGLSPSGILWSL